MDIIKQKAIDEKYETQRYIDKVQKQDLPTNDPHLSASLIALEGLI